MRITVSLEPLSEREIVLYATNLGVAKGISGRCITFKSTFPDHN